MPPRADNHPYQNQRHARTRLCRREPAWWQKRQRFANATCRCPRLQQREVQWKVSVCAAPGVVGKCSTAHPRVCAWCYGRRSATVQPTQTMCNLPKCVCKMLEKVVVVCGHEGVSVRWGRVQERVGEEAEN